MKKVLLLMMAFLGMLGANAQNGPNDLMGLTLPGSLTPLTGTDNFALDFRYESVLLAPGNTSTRSVEDADGTTGNREFLMQTLFEPGTVAFNEFGVPVGTPMSTTPSATGLYYERDGTINGYTTFRIFRDGRLWFTMEIANTGNNNNTPKDGTVYVSFNDPLLIEQPAIMPPDITFSYTNRKNNGGCPCGDHYAQILIQAGAPLPVEYKSFNAQRNKSTVALTWTTAQEQNNKGFEVLRKMDGAGFQSVGFVASKSFDGNSANELSYDFSDPNMAKGVTQYQLRQIDKDGKSKLSDVRIVQGMEFSRKMLVYPNPSTSGNVSLQFSNTDAKDISVIDMSGRTLKRVMGYTQAKLDLTGLVGGTYNVRVFNRATSEMSVESFVIMRK
jgi:Secretion system C-terminal sorting domain